MATKADAKEQAVMRQSNMDVLKAQNLRKELYLKYKSEPTVPMYLSPMYRPYFSNVMRVTINGISIFFKVDGTTQQVPQTFADEITARRLAIDNMLTRQSKMENVANNFESSPGEIKLF